MNRIVASALACALGVGGVAAVATSAQAAPVKTVRVVHAGSSLSHGQSLSSPNGAYVAAVGRSLTIARRGKVIWSRYAGRGARLVFGRHGNLALTAGGRTTWSTRTHAATSLVLGNQGVLALLSPAGTVWTNRMGNRCNPHLAGKNVQIDLGHQSALLCNDATQLLTTPITSGAVDLGDGTPTGTWRVQSKQRDRYLYPAAGGAYYVHYWLPYDGAYGMHDSPWQRFPYGSRRYRTEGSHGCVHFPGAAIAWMYGWIRIGTLVHIYG
jgi:hypothetical protein